MRPPPHRAAPHRPPAGPDTLGRPRGHPVLIDEHEGGDELSLRVQQVDLRAWRDHVGEEVADARGELVDELDGPFAVAAHFPATWRFANRTRSRPSSMM